MLNGLYSSATALEIFTRQQEAVSTNLAHLNTPGHRRVLYSFHEKNQSPENRPGTGDGTQWQPGTRIGETAVDFSPGRHEPTERPLDVAISGDGFFAYQGADGEVFSRAGVLFRGQGGQLVNSDGLPILSNGAPISISAEVSDRDLIIDSSGNISANGQQIGSLPVVRFNDNQLLASDNQTYFRIGDATKVPADDATVMQGFRELSNASPVSELINLIIGSRHFESAQKAIRTISDAIQENVRS